MTRSLPAVNAPEFPAGLEWLNTDKPIRLADLRGKVVLLDFWTYCCINCMHIIPDLKRLEQKYGSALTVIGVHSAKFTTEHGTDNIRQAILRYGIEHPVVNDSEFRVWDEYTAHAWPTLILIDTKGKVVAQESGEGAFDRFDEPIGRLVAEAEARGALDRTPLKLRLERDRVPEGVLSFPGKVLADSASNRLFIADSNHNRIVVASLADGSVLDVIGSGAAGLLDGAFDAAAFLKPQGLALDGDALYVADTENHAIRRVDLKARKVETVAGTGEQARQFNVGGAGTSVALNSPWDLVMAGGALYVAMAGSHQIWRLDPKSGQIEPYAGTAAEARVDGPLLRSALAQPSGITTDGKRLYVADSEVSSVRSVDLDPNGRVGTIVGDDLFVFGDKDGVGDAVRLQHPLGVVWQDGALFVADTYNSKIKRVDPAGQESRTFAGTGKHGYKDGEWKDAQFDEPGGVSAANGKVYVADTNNHAVRVIDVATRRVGTLKFKGVERLARPMPAAKAEFKGQVVELPEQRVAPGAVDLVFDVAPASGLKLNGEAPFYFGLAAADAAAVTVPAASASANAENPSFPRRVAFTAASGRTVLTFDAVLYYCEAGKESLCYLKQVRFRVPVRVEAGAGREVRVAYALAR
jgi:DNA-binding beta-propeller fold protein YncE